jgi:hypothetical protein
MSMKQFVNWELALEKEALREKLSQFPYVHQKSHIICIEIAPRSPHKAYRLSWVQSDYRRGLEWLSNLLKAYRT